MTTLTARKPKRMTGDSIDLVSVESTDTFWNFVGCEKVNIIASRFFNCVLRFENVTDLNILGCAFSECRGSHFIQFDPTSSNKNVCIVNNIFAGPQLPAYRDETGELVDNGATGDCIAVRACDGFSVCGNVIFGGGELGITVLAGSKNGVVSRNQIIDGDAGGIWIGNGDDATVENVVVDGNKIIRCAHNMAPEANAINQAGISIRNARNIVVSNNLTTESCSDLQFGIFARDCDGLTVGGNSFDTKKRFRIPRDGNVRNLVSDMAATT